LETVWFPFDETDIIVLFSIVFIVPVGFLVIETGDISVYRALTVYRRIHSRLPRPDFLLESPGNNDSQS